MGHSHGPETEEELLLFKEMVYTHIYIYIYIYIYMYIYILTSTSVNTDFAHVKDAQRYCFH